uniref:Uncharacterized protein n=1 Tax=Rhizophora mucronata TaxID=61149 RepID=A0A2P2Q5M6_RHIMU
MESKQTKTNSRLRLIALSFEKIHTKS